MKYCIIPVLLIVSIFLSGCIKKDVNLTKSHQVFALTDGISLRGFRTVEWGATLVQDSEFLLIEPSKYGKKFLKKNEKITLYGANLYQVVYKTYNDIFYSVSINFSGSDNYGKLLSQLNMLYGTSSDVKQEINSKYFESTWNLFRADNGAGKPEIRMILDYSEVKQIGKLNIYHLKSRPPLSVLF